MDLLMCLCQISRYTTHASQLSLGYARVLYASEAITIHHRLAGGTSTAIKAKYERADIFTFASPELQGGRCSGSSGCPEGVLRRRRCRGYGVVWLRVFLWQQLVRATHSAACGRINMKADRSVQQRRQRGTSCLSLTAPHVPPSSPAA